MPRRGADGLPAARKLDHWRSGPQGHGLHALVRQFAREWILRQYSIAGVNLFDSRRTRGREHLSAGRKAGMGPGLRRQDRGRGRGEIRLLIGDVLAVGGLVGRWGVPAVVVVIL